MRMDTVNGRTFTDEHEIMYMQAGPVRYSQVYTLHRPEDGGTMRLLSRGVRDDRRLWDEVLTVAMSNTAADNAAIFAYLGQAVGAAIRANPAIVTPDTFHLWASGVGCEYTIKVADGRFVVSVMGGPGPVKELASYPAVDTRGAWHLAVARVAEEIVGQVYTEMAT